MDNTIDFKISNRINTTTLIISVNEIFDICWDIIHVRQSLHQQPEVLPITSDNIFQIKASLQGGGGGKKPTLKSEKNPLYL